MLKRSACWLYSKLGTVSRQGRKKAPSASKLMCVETIAMRSILVTNLVGKKQAPIGKKEHPKAGGDGNERNNVIVSNRECIIDISPFQGLT